MESTPSEVPEPSVQCSTIRWLEKQFVKRISTVAYLLDAKWFARWKAYVGYEGSTSDVAPGAIDNSRLRESLLYPYSPLKEGSDYIVCSSDMWRHFVLWFGGGPALARPILEYCLVELYPIGLLFSSGTQTRMITFGRNNSLKRVRTRLCCMYWLPPHRCSLLVNEKLVDNLDQTISEFGIAEARDVVTITYDSGHLKHHE